MNWITSFPCNRAQAEALSDEHPDLAPFDPPPVIVALEEDEDADRWRIDAYTDGAPEPALIAVIMRLIGMKGKAPVAQRLPDEDWVTISQQGLEPVRAGRFYVHTDNDTPDPSPDVVNLVINASQAFGTGHHDTTAGCLNALDQLKRQGQRFTDIADLGTGTGLLAFAAMHLWPRASVVASDIDPVSIDVTLDNAVVNHMPIGPNAGELALVVSDGTQHPFITGRAPYDLVIANILAGPLIALAPAIAEITATRGKVVLAGLIERQRDDVIRAYRRVGFRVDQRGAGAWPTLVLTKRHSVRAAANHRPNGGAGLPPGDFGAW